MGTVPVKKRIQLVHLTEKKLKMKRSKMKMKRKMLL
jgi:hypothetical protein